MSQYIRYPSNTGGGGGTVTNVTASGPLSSSGGATPNISLTGIIPIVNGGTGQASKSAAFDALSPMTTGGDIIYGGASGTGTRLANGTAGQLLQSNGTTLAPTWVAPGANTALSNLISTSINQNLKPNVDTAFDLGTSGIRWGNVFSTAFRASNLFTLTGLSSLTVTPTGPDSVTYDSGVKVTNGKTFIVFTDNGTASNNMYVATGNASAGNSGNVKLETGTATGTRGQIILKGASIDASTSQIHNVVNPTSAQDAATKAYVDAASPTGSPNSVAFFNGSSILDNDPKVEYTTSYTPAFPPFPMRGFFAKTDLMTGSPPIFTFGSLDTAIDSPATDIFFSSGSNTAVGAVNDTGDTAFFTGAITDATSSARTGALTFNTGNNQGTGASGGADFVSGQTLNGNSGSVQFQTGQATGTGQSGNLFFESGQSNTNNSGQLIFESGNSQAGGATGDLDFRSGDTNASGSGASGTLNFITGNTLDGLSGNINMTTGTPSGVGDSGTFNFSTGQSGPTGKSGDVNLGSGPGGGSGDTGAVTLYSGTSNGNSGNTLLRTGNSSGGNSGNVTLLTGTATGTRGSIQFLNGTEGTAGYVWTSTDTSGSGSWIAPASSGANTALSNLTTTAINADLIPDIPGARALGNGTTQWASAVINVLNDHTDNPTIDPINRFLFDAANSASIDWASRHLIDSSGTNALNYNNRQLIDSSGATAIDFSGTDIDASTRKIVNVIDPTAAQDAATKNYVDTAGTGQEFHVSAAATTASSNITATSFTTFSNSPTLTFTPALTGKYKVYCHLPVQNVTGVNSATMRILASAGTFTLLQESQTSMYGATSTLSTDTVQSNFTLTSGSSVSFDIQGLVATGGTIKNRGDLAQFYIFAERISA